MSDNTNLEKAASLQKYAAILSKYERKYPMIWSNLSASVYANARNLMEIEIND